MLIKCKAANSCNYLNKEKKYIFNFYNRVEFNLGFYKRNYAQHYD